jgi:hypothetical protein
MLPAMLAAGPAPGAARTVREPVPRRGAAAWHLATAVTATSGLVLQVVLTTTAGGTNLPTRLLRLGCHFTVQALALVAVTGWLLAVRPGRGISTVFRVARLDALLGIVATGLVYLVVLRPVIDLDGWWAVADTVLHYIVPLLAVAGWVAFGPRRRVDVRVVLLALGWPAAFFGWTALHGWLSGFYPYPFLDVREIGYGATLVDTALALGLLLGLGLSLLWADQWLTQRARRPRRSGRGPG